MTTMDADVCQVFLDAPRSGQQNLPRSLYERMATQATAEHRTTSSLVRHACERYLEYPDRPGLPS